MNSTTTTLDFVFNTGNTYRMSLLLLATPGARKLRNLCSEFLSSQS